MVTSDEMTRLRDTVRASERDPAPIGLLIDRPRRKGGRKFQPIIQPDRIDLTVATVIIGTAKNKDVEMIAQQEGMKPARVQAIVHATKPYWTELRELDPSKWTSHLFLKFPQLRGQIPSRVMA